MTERGKRVGGGMQRIVARPAADAAITETPREANARRLWALALDVKKLSDEVRALRKEVADTQKQRWQPLKSR